MNKKSFIGGLVCGEGWFSFYKVKNSPNHIQFSFGVAMHIRDLELLKLIQSEIGCGKIYFHPSSRDKNMARFEVANQRLQVEKIIPFFNDILLGYKKIQFEKWKEALLNHYAGRKERRRIASSKAWSKTRASKTSSDNT